MPFLSQPKGLYKGMSAPLVGITPIFAVCFWAYDVGKNIMRWAGNVPEGKDLSLLQIGIAGALSAVPTTVRLTASVVMLPLPPLSGAASLSSWQCLVVVAVLNAGDHGPRRAHQVPAASARRCMTDLHSYFSRA